MAVDLWPYSDRNGGAVTDLEHEYLWSADADGVLPGQAGNACQVGLSGSMWTVQPGRFRIAGHVLDMTTVQSGALPTASSATRRSVVAAFIDRTKSPWQFGVQLVPGSPGGGRPALSASRTGIYQAPLRALDTATNGTVTLLPDERIILTPAGGGLLRGKAASAAEIPLLVTGADGQTGVMASFRKPDGYRMFDISAVGRTGINTNGPSSSIGLYVKGAATNDITMRVAKLPGQTSDILQVVNESNAVVVRVDSAGNLTANNFAATEWASYTPTWDHTGAASFSSNTGRWKRISEKTVAFSVFINVGVAGSGASSPITFRLPTVPRRSIGWVFHGYTKQPGSILSVSLRSDGASNVVDEILQVTATRTAIMTGIDLLSDMELTISGVYEEA